MFAIARMVTKKKLLLRAQAPNRQKNYPSGAKQAQFEGILHVALPKFGTNFQVD